MNLITSFYLESNPERLNELGTCIRMNAALEGHSLHILCEGADAAKRAADIAPGATIIITGRPKFKEFISYSNSLVKSENEITAIFNTDIFFNETLGTAAKLLDERTVIALSRWDQIDGKLHPYHKPDSQDVWIWRGKLKPLRYLDFFMGKPGCDNRFAHELFLVGYKLINPAHDIIAIHLHESGVRNYTRKLPDLVPAPYKHVPPDTVSRLTSERIQDEKLDPFPRSEFNFKRVLHVGFPMESLINAFQKNTDSYQFIDWRKVNAHNLQEVIIEAADKIKPDLVFCQTQTPGVIVADTVKQLREKGAFVVNWCGDVRAPLPPWYIIMGEFYNLTLFSNLNDVEEMKSKGLNCEYLQIGFDNHIFKPKESRYKKFDLVFMGNNYQNVFPLSNERQALVELLGRSLGNRFGLFGNGWRRSLGNLNERYEKEAAQYANSIMALSFSHFNYSRYFSDRLLRAMGTGTMVLSHNYEGIEKDFIVGYHLEVFENTQDILRKIQQYKRNPAAAAKIGKQGAEYVHENCTWEIRLQELQAQIEKYI